MTTAPEDAATELALREAALHAREDALCAREDALARRALELDLRDTHARDVLVPSQMREANEQLVLTSLRAQEMADAASLARLAAESVRDKLAVTEAALRDASGRKDAFLAMLGHELRNPLAPIVTALEVMKLRAPDSSVDEREVIERQVRHMVELIDDLLDVSRIASGKLVLHRTRVEIASVVGQAIETVGPLLESRHHALELAVPETGLAVSGDAGRLAQVIANLLANAAKYTDPGGHISVAARREAGKIRIAVKDDGPGIPSALLPVVFDRFVQAEQTIERAGGGLGLGLAIVKSLVELHGGEVAAFSDGQGRGSEFVVTLPEVADVPVDEATIRTPPPTHPSAERVLIVDDNADAAEMLAMALQVGGRAIEIASDGPEALHAFERFAPDAVVLDIGLPVMDGYEVARRLREIEREHPETRRPPVRLIALTGYGQASDRERSAEAGMDAHLVKPVDLAVLETALAAQPHFGPARSASPAG